MRRLRAPADLPDVFVGSQAVRAGLLRPAHLRGNQVVRVLHGVYRPAWVPASYRLKCRAAGLLLPSAARLTGPSAASVLGCELADESDDVTVLVPGGTSFGPYRGIAVKTLTRVPDGPVQDGLRLTSPLRIAFDLAARRSLADGVALLDAFGRRQGIDPTVLRRWLGTQHCHDVVAVRAAADLMDVRAQSPQESRLRVHLGLAGIHLVPQHEVWHAGRLVARTDLADPEHRLAVEYDGAWHALREQLEMDRARLNALRDAGWAVVHVTASMLRRPADAVAAVRSALADRRDLPGLRD